MLLLNAQRPYGESLFQSVILNDIYTYDAQPRWLHKIYYFSWVVGKKIGKKIELKICSENSHRCHIYTKTENV